MTDSVTPVAAAIARTATLPVAEEQQTARQASAEVGNNTPPKRPAPAAVDIKRAVERLSEFVEGSRRSLRFRVDDLSGRTVITVVNSTTDEVIRQIPAEEVLALARNLRDSSGAVIVTRA